MNDAPDAKLLEQFARNQSEAAFAELVKRHISLVYSVAFRKTGNPQLAEDVTQAVFIILASKADSLGAKTVLPGWLYHTARLTAANAQRAEMRRIRHEQEAFMQSIENECAPDALWRELSPLLEDAMAGLGASDRDALVLRYFQKLRLVEVGAALGITESVAQRRVSRALEKLRRFFAKRGVHSTTDIIAGAISSNSLQTAPAALAQSVTAAAVTKGAAASASTLTLIKGALKVMAWSKAKTAIVAGAGILLFATTAVTVKKIQSQNNSDSQWDTGVADQMILFNGPHVVRILPTRFPNRGGWTSIGRGRELGFDNSADDIARYAYGGAPCETVFLTALPKKKYDFIANLDTNDVNIGGAIWPASNYALQQEVKKQFGVVAQYENIETNVLFLKVRSTNAPGLRPSTTPVARGNVERPGELKLVKTVPLGVVMTFEDLFKMPVVNQTGLDGSFDVDLKWNPENDPQQENLKQAVLNQLGLELVPGKASVEILLVEKAR